MLFLAGLKTLSREERVALLAQLNVITPANILNEAAQGRALAAKKWVAPKLTGAAEHLSRPIADKIRRWNEQTDWNPAVLAKRLEHEASRLSTLEDGAVLAALRSQLSRVGGMKPDVDNVALATAVLRRAAHSLKLDATTYADPVSLESKVFESCLDQRLKQIRVALEKLGPDKSGNLERLIREELNRLSAAEREAIRQALKLEQLSAEALVSVLRTGAGVLVGQALVGSFGFGAYLFLSTSLKALSLLLGTSFAFGTYMAASGFLAFLLSGPFLVAVLLASGGLVYWKTGQTLDGYLAATLVLIGRGKLLGQEFCSAGLGNSSSTL